jgi:nucleolar complex protein 2
MYLDYLKNCKFTSPTTLPLINFMQRSLVELYSLDPTVTYQHGFVFLRQLAVHLRTAIQTKKPVKRKIDLVEKNLFFF